MLAIRERILGVLLVAATIVACGGSSALRDGSVGDGDGGGLPDAADGDAAPSGGPVTVYVGGGDAKIHVFEMDRTTLALRPSSETKTGDGPTFLAFDPQRRWLVAVNEYADAIESFTIDAQSGALTRKDGAPSEGGGPAHVALDRSGAWVLVANYGGGNVAVLPIDAAGTLGTASAIVDAGEKAHQIVADAANGTLYVPCLGDDRVVLYGFDAGAGKLSTRAPVELPGGGGPRHIALHPGGKLAYVVNELSSTITTFAIAADGSLASRDTVSTLPEDFVGVNTGAEIEVHPSGKFVYSSNRGDDSIAIFAVGLSDGKLTPRGHVKTGGTQPRHFSLVEAGSVLLVANQGSDSIHGFQVSAATGALSPAGKLADVPGPQFVGAIQLPGR